MPIHPRAWSEADARHLLRRIGFSSTPAALTQATALGLQGTLKAAYGAVRPMPVPTRVQYHVSETPNLRQQRNASEDDEERRQIDRQIRQINESAYQDFAIRWLQFARQPENSAQEKYVMFLQNLFVVGRNKVNPTGFLFQHQELIRDNAYASYPDLVKVVSRSPAMIQYLDLNRSHRRAPNENFARELFELFTLGEGNYTERDIKEAARAFTGYRNRGGDYHFERGAYDPDPKTVFGRTGPWNGDQVIDLVYEQPAASTFVPREFLRFYVTDDPLPDLFVEQLGTLWRQQNFSMRALIEIVFTSRLFYAPELRGNLIKSPIHYYIGLCQDLNLDVAPFPARVLPSLRNMGQMFQNPPNVRGWVGGKHWINTTTLAARRQLAHTFFTPIREDRLNADDLASLQQARTEGRDALLVTDERLGGLSGQTPDFIARHLCRYFLPVEPSEAYIQSLIQYLESHQSDTPEAIRTIVIAMLQSPPYQLC